MNSSDQNPDTVFHPSSEYMPVHALTYAQGIFKKVPVI